MSLAEIIPWFGAAQEKERLYGPAGCRAELDTASRFWNHGLDLLNEAVFGLLIGCPELQDQLRGEVPRTVLPGSAVIGWEERLVLVHATWARMRDLANRLKIQLNLRQSRELTWEAFVTAYCELTELLTPSL